MQHTSLIKRLSKIATVTSEGRTFTAIAGENKIQWIDQDNWVVCLCIPGEGNDSMTDYFTDTWLETIKEAVNTLLRGNPWKGA